MSPGGVADWRSPDRWQAAKAREALHPARIGWWKAVVDGAVVRQVGPGGTRNAGSGKRGGAVSDKGASSRPGRRGSFPRRGSAVVKGVLSCAYVLRGPVTPKPGSLSGRSWLPTTEPWSGSARIAGRGHRQPCTGDWSPRRWQTRGSRRCWSPMPTPRRLASWGLRALPWSRTAPAQVASTPWWSLLIIGDREAGGRWCGRRLRGSRSGAHLWCAWTRAPTPICLAWPSASRARRPMQGRWGALRRCGGCTCCAHRRPAGTSSPA